MIYQLLILDASGTLLTERPMGFGAPVPAKGTRITVDGMRCKVVRVRIDYDTNPMRVSLITEQQ